MKETPLTGKHIKLGARMAEFAGYNMPIQYTAITDEHMCVRENVGIFDVSHMGEFILRGKHALDLIQKATTNNAARLEIGEAQYSCMPNLEGGIVDDLLVYRLNEDHCSEGEKAFMLVVNASNIEKDWNWLNGQNDFDTRLIDISDQTGLLAVQGPNAVRLLQKLTDVPLTEISYYTFVKGTIGHIENVLISATGYTGSGGFELYVKSTDLPDLWDLLFQAGESFGVKPCGLGARDTLRLEMGYCLYGNDLTDDTSPIEAGLGWITKLKKGAFNSSEIFNVQKEAGISRKLVGFIVKDRRVPRHGYPIMDKEGQAIGNVTSGTSSPCLQIPIGMGYVAKSHWDVGTRIWIDSGRKTLEAEIVKLPFYQK